MFERLKNTLIISSIAVMSIIVVILTATYESPENRVERIGNLIKCPVCQGESIANSPATMARDMMDLIGARVEAGRSDDAIIDELLSSFTGAVLLDPPVSGSTLLLWLAPLAALLVGIAVIWWWRRHPGVEPVGPVSRTDSGKRGWVGGLVLAGGFGLIVLVAGAFLQDRANTTSGAAQVGIDNLDDVSNETMEAVIAANLDNTQINGMRLALAERYFASGDYQAAFPHFLTVAESETATISEATTALIRLGWMAYDGNGETEAATSLFDQALALSPGSSVALYLKGQVLWCGTGDFSTASRLFEQVLSSPDLESDTREQVQKDYDLAKSGASCA